MARTLSTLPFTPLLSAFLLFSASVSSADAPEKIQLIRQDKVSAHAIAYSPRITPCRGRAIISPGAGGSEEGYRYLGEGLSSLGYLAVVVGHPESGRRSLIEKIWRNGVRGGLHDGLVALTTDPSAYRGRLMDSAAASQWARARCEASESLFVGHSMGAATVMMEAGAQNLLAVTGSDSFTAYIALSPQGTGAIFPPRAWEGIKKPVLLLTGTRDIELGKKSWQTRTEPFENMRPGCKWLGVVDGATHLNLAGRGFSRRVEASVLQVIGTFLNGIRSGSCSNAGRLSGVELRSK